MWLQNKESCFNVAYMLIIVMYNTPPPSSLFPSISSPPVVHESSNGAGKGSEPHPGQWPGGTFVRPHCTGTSDVHHYTVYGVVYRAAVLLVKVFDYDGQKYQFWCKSAAKNTGSMICCSTLTLYAIIKKLRLQLCAVNQVNWHRNCTHTPTELPPTVTRLLYCSKVSVMYRIERALNPL